MRSSPCGATWMPSSPTHRVTFPRPISAPDTAGFRTVQRVAEAFLLHGAACADSFRFGIRVVETSASGACSKEDRHSHPRAGRIFHPRQVGRFFETEEGFGHGEHPSQIENGSSSSITTMVVAGRTSHDSQVPSGDERTARAGGSAR